MQNEELASGGKFYAICAQGLRSAQMGQYGDAFTADDLKKNLDEQAAGFDKSFSSWPYAMISPGVDALNEMITSAVALYQAWLDAGKPSPK